MVFGLGLGLSGFANVGYQRLRIRGGDWVGRAAPWCGREGFG